MLPLDRFLSFIGENNLFNPDEKVLLAVSGGKDSVLMTHLFNEAGFKFGIAHCNFQLRGDESREDASFTSQLALKLGVPYFNISFDTAQYAKEHQLSIQMAARELRYNWFEEVRSEGGYNYIALAHHQSDTTETVLLNLVRGTGIAGLHGILPKRDRLIRPLLFLKRDEIDTIVESNNLPYREDSSNSSNKYARNKIRIDVIPALKEINPLLEDTFEKNGKRFQELEDFLNQQVSHLREQLFKTNPSGDLIIQIEALKNLQPQRLMLYELFKPFNFKEPVMDDLAKSWDRHAGKIFESVHYQLLLDRGQLILSERNIFTEYEKLIEEGDAITRWGNLVVNISEAERSNTDIRKQPSLAYFDKELLQFPLKLRHWKEGDYFHPFGMKGRKKLSDYFVATKVSLRDKKRIPILENGNGDILWVVGYRADDRYKITAHTKKVIIFETHKNYDN
jgi:tRNA(Ile)-lysidine synthase